ncbi:rho guanine nucleotide exchange factor 7-like [Sycon ciliatum]|uniref:rho guanine nucleotide exchange factor 7-like n=1 Tax=Sycon ciliatum TaxID=27933 RepID=UPI0020AEC5D0|eukprot:scpid34142/ scgid16612/ Rho guanine nucleotide exchange factor 7; Beta-Pix; COOL-1; PAK-interacting exchange factor beta; p85
MAGRRMKADEVKAWLMLQGLVIEENTEHNLHELLRDGLVLCQLANRLKPRSAAALNYNIENRPAWNDNVATFLEACDKIGVQKFAPEDLIEDRDMDAVLSTMSELARKATSMGMGPKTSDSSSSSPAGPPPAAAPLGTGSKAAAPAMPGLEAAPVMDKPYAEKPISLLRRSIQSLPPKDVSGSVVSSGQLSELALEAGMRNRQTTSTASDRPAISRCKAAYSYRGSSIDELQFHIGDVIEVTQKMEGGWWEGRVDDKLGWFPCAYTKEMDKDGNVIEGTPSYTESLGELSTMTVPPSEPASYHSMVLQNAINVEEAHVNELQAFVEKYLQALRSTNILNSSELLILSGNIEELISFHSSFLSDLQEINRQPIAQREMAKCYLNVAPQVRQLCSAYCANHPQAVELLCAYGDKLSLFMESHGASGIMELTTNLSKPFRHLDMYPKVLLEIQRHTPDDHVDRASIDQALPVFEEIVVYTANTRRHKEQELDMINGTIEGWTGDAITTLGKCSLMSTTKTRTADGEEDDRYLLLFAGYLVVLRVADQLTGYTLVAKCPLPEAAIMATNEVENGVSILAGSHKMVVSASSEEERDLINTLWEKCSRLSNASYMGVGKPTPPPSRHQSAIVPDPQTKSTRSHTVGSRPEPTNGLGPRRSAASNSANTNQSKSTTLPHYSAQSRGTFSLDTEPVVTRARRWSFRSMRPPPPMKPALAVYGSKDGDGGKSLKKKMLMKGRRKSEVDDSILSVSKSTDQKALDDDSILKVIEAYCTSNRAKGADISNKGEGGGTTV